MNKPKIFISSTIYDFEDLRSALKYWLQEYGFDTQLSEYNDFDKNVTLNSYDACLEAISNCDYFLLLIGNRSGGKYPNEEKSITQKEYETAYELVKSGKIKKIITLIRKNVWDVKEDRKALAHIISDLKEKEEYKNIPKSQIVNHPSKFLDEADKIISFINIVTRNAESKNNQKPVMNWVHTFSTYNEVIDTLKSELGLRQSISLVVAENNIKYALIRNLQYLLSKEDGLIQCYYKGFADVRRQLEINRINYVKDNNYIISLDADQINNMSDFVLFARVGIKDLETYVFENILSSGIFLTYSKEKEHFVESDLNRAIHQMIIEINRLKIAEVDFSFDIQDRLITAVRAFKCSGREKYNLRFFDLAMINTLYERIVNIISLTRYMLTYINTYDTNLKFPQLIGTLAKIEQPTEQDVLNFLDL